MPNCKICKKPVDSGVVMHSECVAGAEGRQLLDDGEQMTYEQAIEALKSCKRNTYPFHKGAADIHSAIDIAVELLQQCGEPKPLTLDALKELADAYGASENPVWIWFESVDKNGNISEGGYVALFTRQEYHEGMLFRFNGGLFDDVMAAKESDYGMTWLAYDREPRRDVQR